MPITQKLEKIMFDAVTHAGFPVLANVCRDLWANKPGATLADLVNHIEENIRQDSQHRVKRAAVGGWVGRSHFGPKTLGGAVALLESFGGNCRLTEISHKWEEIFTPEPPREMSEPVKRYRRSVADMHRSKLARNRMTPATPEPLGTVNPSFPGSPVLRVINCG